MAYKINNEELTKIGMTNEETERFLSYRNQYLTTKEKLSHNAEHFDSPPENIFIDYNGLQSLPSEKRKAYLDKVIVIKLNGGMGTTMGLSTPKSLLEVQKGVSFLDIIVQQIEILNNTYQTDIPLLLLNSFSTDGITKKVIGKYAQRNVKVHTFLQSTFPRLNKTTLRPIPKNRDDLKHWNPPGSGDVFEALHNSGLLEKFIAEGKVIAFISNVENIGGTVGREDLKLLQYILDQEKDFLLEVTERLITDHLGGVLVRDLNVQGEQLRLLELGQVPEHERDKFKANKFRFWNTNNIWIRLPALVSSLKDKTFRLTALANTRNVDGETLVQIEMPAGTAIRSFPKSAAVIVPRTRYREVKTTADLLVLQSNIFSLGEDGRYVLNPARLFTTIPVVKLGDHFSKTADYHKRFKTLPDMLELDHLTVSGDVYFGENVTLRGNIIIVANHGEQVHIPDGAVLENKIMSGNLRILDH